MDHDENYEDTWEDKRMNGHLTLKTMCYQLLPPMLDIQNVWKKKQDLARKIR